MQRSPYRAEHTSRSGSQVSLTRPVINLSQSTTTTSWPWATRWPRRTPEPNQQNRSHHHRITQQQNLRRCPFNAQPPSATTLSMRAVMGPRGHLRDPPIQIVTSDPLTIPASARAQTLDRRSFTRATPPLRRKPATYSKPAIRDHPRTVAQLPPTPPNSPSVPVKRRTKTNQDSLCLVAGDDP